MEGIKGNKLMFHQIVRKIGLTLSVLLVAGCASTPTAPEAPKTAQNLLGSTDELQLVTELSLGLADEHGGEQVLVVLEIDGMLLSMKQGQDNNPCANDAMDSSVSKMQLTQADAADQVRRMQTGGMKVIVLTSRGPDCRAQTFAELNSHGFNFTKNAWPPQKGYAEPFLPNSRGRPVVYEHGVLFAAGQNKGIVLKAMLDKASGTQPTLIVIADPSRENLNAVMKTFSWSGTKVHAWRYTRETTVEHGP
jgi:hypothetical protein